MCNFLYGNDEVVEQLMTQVASCDEMPSIYDEKAPRVRGPVVLSDLDVHRVLDLRDMLIADFIGLGGTAFNDFLDAGLV